MKILAVDDEPIILDLLKSILDPAGYTDITFAGSAAEALEILNSTDSAFDCFLLDIVMPGMDGIELCREIRKYSRYKSAPVIMITRMADKSYFDRAFAAGATDYVTKPFDGFELGTRMRLADQMNSQQRLVLQNQEEVSCLRSELLAQSGFELSTPIVLEDTNGFIQNVALENYLSTLAEGLYAMQIFAIKITNITGIYEKSTPSQFRTIIKSVGEIISETLPKGNFFFTYSGDGVFSCVLHGRTTGKLDEFILHLLTELGKCGITLANDDTVIPEVVVGRSSRPKFVKKENVLDAMREAVISAEAVACEYSLRSSDSSPKPMPLTRLISRMLGAI